MKTTEVVGGVKDFISSAAQFGNAVIDIFKHLNSHERDPQRLPVGIQNRFSSINHLQDYLDRSCPIDGMPCGACPYREENGISSGCDYGAIREMCELRTLRKNLDAS